MQTDEQGAWLVRQLRVWPHRVDPNRTTNVTYLMSKAVKMIEALRQERDRLHEALEKCHMRFVDYEKLHQAKGTADGYRKAQANRDMVDMINAALSPTNGGDSHG